MLTESVLEHSIVHENYIDDMRTYDDGDLIDAVAGLSDDESIDDIYDADEDIGYIDGNDIDFYADDPIYNNEDEEE